MRLLLDAPRIGRLLNNAAAVELLMQVLPSGISVKEQTNRLMWLVDGEMNLFDAARDRAAMRGIDLREMASMVYYMLYPDHPDFHQGTKLNEFVITVDPLDGMWARVQTYAWLDSIRKYLPFLAPLSGKAGFMVWSAIQGIRVHKVPVDNITIVMNDSLRPTTKADTLTARPERGKIESETT